jgi:hypothetical protein
MGMEFGKMIKRFIKEVIVWIKNKVLEYINGLENKYIKVNLNKTLERVMDSFIV